MLVTFLVISLCAFVISFLFFYFGYCLATFIVYFTPGFAVID